MDAPGFGLEDEATGAMNLRDSGIHVDCPRRQCSEDRVHERAGASWQRHEGALHGRADVHRTERPEHASALPLRFDQSWK